MSRRVKRLWTEADISKLRSMARKLPTDLIARELGRGRAATALKAHQLGISLRMKPERGSKDDVRCVEPGAARRDLSPDR